MKMNDVLLGSKVELSIKYKLQFEEFSESTVRLQIELEGGLVT